MDTFQHYLLVSREEGTLIKDGLLGIPPVLVLLLQLLTQLIVVFFQVTHKCSFLSYMDARQKFQNILTHLEYNRMHFFSN